MVIGFSDEYGMYEYIPNGSDKIAPSMRKLEMNQDDGERVFRFDLVSRHLRWLQGEVLTVIDAAIDGEKNKAIKDLIKDKFSSKIDWMYQLGGLVEEQQVGLVDPE